jgi:hypothetical protein
LRRPLERGQYLSIHRAPGGRTAQFGIEEFLLSNAVDAGDHWRAVEDVRAMGLDPADYLAGP